MTSTITEHTLTTDRHATFYLACGDPGGVPIIFCHGWPELSVSWRHQLPTMAERGLYAIAPDMRGYGRSSQYDAPSDHAVAESEADMIELLDHLGAEKAIWVGHDWGTPIVWSMAQHHPDRCHGVAGLCVPYFPKGFILPELVRQVDRALYPEEAFPVGQWDYWLFHRTQPDLCRQALEGHVRNTFYALFRAGEAAAMAQPSLTAMVQALGGWFGPDGAAAPELPLDTSVLTQAEATVYIDAFERTGFGGANMWYLNDALNSAHADAAPAPHLDMPVLFIHAAYDAICNTATGTLADPMRAHCSALTEATVDSGHWIAQEKPAEVNAILTEWIDSALEV